MRMVYRYPQTRFPYEELVAQSGARSKMEGEFELWNANALADNRFFDIEIDYAKATPHDILIRAVATNCGPEPAVLHLLPTIWFRNTWSWGRNGERPILQAVDAPAPKIDVVEASHHGLGQYRLYCEDAGDMLFTENESNLERLWGVPNQTPFVKDSINDRIVHDKIESTNPRRVGTKAAAHYKFTIPPNESRTIHLRLTRAEDARKPSAAFRDFDKIFQPSARDPTPRHFAHGRIVIQTKETVRHVHPPQHPSEKQG